MVLQYQNGIRNKSQNNGKISFFLENYFFKREKVSTNLTYGICIILLNDANSNTHPICWDDNLIFWSLFRFIRILCNKPPYRKSFQKIPRKTTWKNRYKFKSRKIQHKMNNRNRKDPESGTSEKSRKCRIIISPITELI